MANPIDLALTSSLSAPASEVPAQQRQSEATSNSSQWQPQTETQQPTQPSKTPNKKEKKEAKGKDNKDANATTDAGAEKLTGAELKKRAKAEKAARRAKEKLEREQAGGGAAVPAGGSGAGGAGQPVTPKKGQPAGGSGGGGGADKGRGIPRRPSAQTPGQLGSAVEQRKKAEEKNVAVFGHLYGQQRRATVAGAGKEVHPAVLALGLQMRDYVVCGSSARCVATLLAFKRVFLFLSGAEWYKVLTILGDRSVYDSPWNLALAPPYDPFVSSDHLPLDMPSALHQSGKCYSGAQAGHRLYRPVRARG